MRSSYDHSGMGAAEAGTHATARLVAGPRDKNTQLTTKSSEDDVGRERQQQQRTASNSTDEGGGHTTKPQQ